MFETINQLILENTPRKFGRAGKSNMAWKITRFIGSFPIIIRASTVYRGLPSQSEGCPAPGEWSHCGQLPPSPARAVACASPASWDFHGVFMDLWIFQLGFNGV